MLSFGQAYWLTIAVQIGLVGYLPSLETRFSF
jgi:hypothetical protein